MFILLRNFRLISLFPLTLQLIVEFCFECRIHCSTDTRDFCSWQNIVFFAKCFSANRLSYISSVSCSRRNMTFFALNMRLWGWKLESKSVPIALMQPYCKSSVSFFRAAARQCFYEDEVNSCQSLVCRKLLFSYTNAKRHIHLVVVFSLVSVTFSKIC